MTIAATYMVPHPPLIIPAVGRGNEQQVAVTIESYNQVGQEIANLAPDTIVVISPHAPMYRDYIMLSPARPSKGNFAMFRAPDEEIQVTYDQVLLDQLNCALEKAELPAGTSGNPESSLDHGTMVPLWFIQKYYKNFKFIRISLSGLPLLSHYQVGKCIGEVLNASDQKIVVIASGDLSHKLKEDGPYGFASEGPVYDKQLVDCCSRGALGELLDFDEKLCEKAAECGHRSFVIMAGMLDGQEVESKFFSYQDLTGVGYTIIGFKPGKSDPNRCFGDILKAKLQKIREENRLKEDAWVKLARWTIEEYIGKSNLKVIDQIPQNLPDQMLNSRKGVFVSIHKFGDLRGCIGTILPTQKNMALEIVQNAISASTRDPRFYPIGPDELDDLEISVDELSVPEPIDSPSQLDVKRYGVIVSCGNRRGLLLPNLDGVDTVEQQLAIAMKKGGIHSSDDWSLERFEVIRHY